MFSLFLLPIIICLLSSPPQPSLHTAYTPHLIVLLLLVTQIGLSHLLRVLGVRNRWQFMSATAVPIFFCPLVGQPQVFLDASLDAAPIYALTTLLGDAFTLPTCGKVARFAPFFQYAPRGVDDDVQLGSYLLQFILCLA